MASGLRPGLRALRAHDGRALRSDLIAGITVAAFLVPQVLAYAGVAGLPAVTGLWAATAALGCYALLGSSRQLSLGPESTTALLTASTVGPLAAGDPHRYAAIAAALAVLVGAICLLGRLARLGFLADMLPRPVLVGYLTGIALIMIAAQLENVTGVPVEGGAFLANIASLAGHIELVHGPTLGMSTTVLAFLLVRGRSSAAPGTWAAGGRAHGGRGERAVRAGPGRHARGRTVPEGLPVPAVPAITLDDIALLLPAALGDRSGLVVYRYDAPLCFANAENLRNRALAVLEVEPATRWLLLNMEAVIEIDLTAADAVHSAA